MTRCLDDKTLFLLSEGEDDNEDRLHVERCQSCAERFERIARDLEFIRKVLQRDPASIGLAPIRMPFLYRLLPIAAALLFGIALVWGESRLWNRTSPSSAELTSNSDLSQFLNQVNDALFGDTNARNGSVSPPDSDVASLQVALGQDCADECRELFANLMLEPSTKTSNRSQPIRPTGLRSR
jgi:hypothetical protein